MALLFMDGFSHYATADINMKWNGGVVNTPSISTSNGRVYGDALETNTSSEYVIWTTNTPLTTIVIGFAHRITVAPSGDPRILSIQSYEASGAEFAAIYWDVSELRYNYRVLGTSVGSSSVKISGEWYYHEVRLVVDQVAGSCQFKIDEVSETSVSNIDTALASFSTSGVDTIWLGESAGISLTQRFDDVYILDSSGSAPNNTFLGDVVVETLFPSGAGATTNFTPSTGSNFQNVDDTNHDGDTTYNSASTVGNRDTFATTNLVGTSATIYGLQTNIVARTSTLGVRSISDVVVSTGTFDGDNFALSANYENYRTLKPLNPNTSAAWTVSEVNAAEFGYEIQV